MASRQSRAYQSNEPIILIWVFVKISTNQSPRVRSWPCRLHESEIQVQGNQRFFFREALVLAASRLSHRKKKKNLWDQGTLRQFETENLIMQFLLAFGCDMSLSNPYHLVTYSPFFHEMEMKWYVWQHLLQVNIATSMATPSLQTYNLCNYARTQRVFNLQHRNHFRWQTLICL